MFDLGIIRSPIFFFAYIFGEYILCVYTFLVFFNEKLQGDIGFDSLSLLPLSK